MNSVSRARGDHLPWQDSCLTTGGAKCSGCPEVRAGRTPPPHTTRQCAAQCSPKGYGISAKREPLKLELGTGQAIGQMANKHICAFPKCPFFGEHLLFIRVY